MVLEIFSIPEVLLNEIDRYAQEQREKETRSHYWIRCPNCGKRVVKKELIKRGCYVCSWQETGDHNKSLNQNAGNKSSPYKSNCPSCGARVITEQLCEKGCYLCGGKDEGV